MSGIFTYKMEIIFIWIALIVLIFIAESLTMGAIFLTPLGLGAVAGAIAQFATESIIISLAAATVVSFICYLLLWPIARKNNDSGDKFGVERLIGMTGTASEIINETEGEVKIDGETWLARSTIIIQPETKVVVQEVDSNKLIVGLE